MVEHLRMPLLFALVALVLRAPALLHVELNWDEALYWQIGGELLKGHAPYTGTWDRKPPGLFAVLAAIQAVAGDGIVALRLGTAAMVVASALALRAIAQHLLPGLPHACTAAGLIYIAGSMRGVGDGTNAELLLAPFALWGIALALSAGVSRHARTALAAGVLGGCALLIKQVAVVEVAVAALVLATLPALAGRGLALGGTARLLAVLGAGVALPVALVAAWYAAIDRLPLLVGVLGAAADAGDAPLNLEGLMAGLRSYGIVIAATLAGLAALLVGGVGRAVGAGAAGLAAWIAGVAAMLLLLGRFADHMMIQALPPLALGTAALAVLVVRALHRSVPWAARHPRLAPAAAALLLLAWGVGTPFLAAAETLWHRQAADVAQGATHWGDRTATIAAALRPRIEGPGDLFVASRMLGLYRETGTTPPTRFPFVLHLWAPYAPIDGLAELQRILGSRPAFVVVDNLWLPGGPRQGDAQIRVLDRLAEALARDYVPDGRTGRFTTWRGGFIGGGIGATVFRRADVPPFTPGQAVLRYDPVP